MGAGLESRRNAISISAVGVHDIKIDRIIAGIQIPGSIFGFAFGGKLDSFNFFLVECDGLCDSAGILVGLA